MKKYKNITNTILAIDCLTMTVYLRPGDVATLPETRDVRYYAGVRHLLRVKESKAVIAQPRKVVKEKKRGRPKKPKVEVEIKKEDNGE